MRGGERERERSKEMQVMGEKRGRMRGARRKNIPKKGGRLTLKVDVNTILAAPRLLLADNDGGQNWRRGEGGKDKGRGRVGGRNSKQQEKKRK